MKPLSASALALPASTIRVMFNMAQSMTDVITFALGEPGFTAAPEVADAGCAAIRQGLTHYTMNAGIPELRAAIAETMTRKKGVDYDPSSEVMVTSGGVEALYLSLRAVLDPGDEVLLGDPYFPNYIGQIGMCGAVPRPVALREEDGFQYRASTIESAITPRTKVVLLNSPSNPTGAITPPKELEAISRVAIDHDLYVITDEVYQDFVYGDASFSTVAAFPGMRDRTVIVDSFSKTYAMTGWRIGMALGPEPIITEMVKMQENVVSCVNTPTQYAALEALSAPESVLQDMIAVYSRNRDEVVSAVNEMEGITCLPPDGAFYAFLNITAAGLSSMDFAMRLLREAHVVVVPGSGFGEAGEGFVRVSYVGTPEETREGLNRMASFAKSLA